MNKLILQFTWNFKEPKLVQTTLKELQNSHFPISNPTPKRQYSKQCGINITITINMYHWYRLESPKINTYIYGQLIADKGAKTIQ